MSCITININKYLEQANMTAYELEPLVGIAATVIYAHARGTAMTQTTYWRYVAVFEALGIQVQEKYSPVEVTVKLRVLRELNNFTTTTAAEAVGSYKQAVLRMETCEYVDQELIHKLLTLYGHTPESYVALDLNEEIVLYEAWYGKDQSIGRALKALRKKTGLTAKELSLAFGWHAAAVSEIERNRDTASFYRVVQLIDLFGHTVGTFNAYRKDQ